MDFNPDYLSKAETEKPELVVNDCQTFEEAQEVFKQMTSEYRIALVIDTDDNSETNIGTHLSKTGGLPLFPDDREWPLCEECGEEMLLKYQIRKQDAPALPTPKDKDMLLLFMCPEDCGEEEPSHEIIWLKEDSVNTPLTHSRGRDTIGKKIHFQPFRDHRICHETDEENINFYSSNLSDCKVRYDIRTIARLMEGIADNSLDERLKHYGQNPLAELESMDNESIEFHEAMELYHIEKDKVGGYPSWVQNASQCHGSYMNILQIEWAEGFWHILVCPECGDYYTEYQGT